MSSVSPEMRRLALWLLEREAAANDSPAADGSGIMGVCETFQRILSALMGVDGYISLLSRALALAKAEAPSLNPVQITANGVLEHLESVYPQENSDDAAHGGEALVAHLLGLLATFIGQPLTLQLVRDAWPDAPFGCPEAESERGS